MENKQTFDGKTNSAPANSCMFEQGIVTFADGGDNDNDFHIEGYSGDIIENHWYWGNVAFDLDGMKFASQKLPVLEDHDRSVKIGFTKTAQKTDKVEFTGKFLSNPAAQQLRNDMKEGFPMQASLSIPPEQIENVPCDSFVMVNGKKLTGPGAVFRKATVVEVSMCTLGADRKTKSKAFADGGEQDIEFNVFNAKEHKMSEKKVQMTAETFAADNPELFSEITEKAKAQGLTDGKADGEKNTREHFAKLVEKFGKDPAFVVEQFSKNVTITAATEAFADKVVAENTQLKAKIAEKKPAQPEAKVEMSADEKALAEFSDDDSKQPLNPGDQSEDALKKKFNADKKLQDEFGGDMAAYIACIKAEKEDRIERV